MVDRYQAIKGSSHMCCHKGQVIDQTPETQAFLGVVAECPLYEHAVMIALALNTMVELKAHSEQFGRL